MTYSIPVATNNGAGGLGVFGRLRVADYVRIVIMLALLAFALSTPGFLSQASIRSLLSAMSFVGCVAVGMTFITLSGNIMSFSLGASLAASTVVFVATLPMGTWTAFALTLLFGAVLNGVQGWIIGYLRANPIIVSMAALSLIIGIMSVITGGRGLYINDSSAAIFKLNFGMVPGPLIAFLICAALGQLILSFTRVGRTIMLSGSNPSALLASGTEPWRYTTWAYCIAGIFTSVSAVLIASRYGSGDLQHGAGFEYGAISAVLVGGTVIHGGRGSVVQTVFGTLLIAILQAVLVLRGFNAQYQHLALGVVVLLVIVLQWKRTS
ncbi:MAG: ABC transporter permease [Polaromonas sp.]|uniref:ABC transporter permease n=1 Tax=Polaromonas sp. TaxID=1869339 RepID=UPI0025E50623|nr:ABC transporter permease [Polaromonas sp.]MBI2726551.1 ABC transporter permease [Polaromonas sp.]